MTNLFDSNITLDAIAQLPLGYFKGHIWVIDNLASLRGCLNLLHEHPILGFDTETKPVFKKGHSNKVALIQLSNNDTCFIFRLNKIGFCDELVEILSNTTTLKIGLSVKDDFRELEKLRHFQPMGFIELQNYVERFGILDKSLKKLAAIIMGIRISKSQQTSNWESETLTDSQLTYAATDAWVCLEIYKRLKEVELTHGEINNHNLKIR
jgi:ribonuclease D